MSKNKWIHSNFNATIIIFLEFIDRLIAILSKYPNLCRFWHYSKLVFVTSKPEHFEIILKSPKALSKDDFYNFFKPAIGDGLFTAPGIT